MTNFQDLYRRYSADVFRFSYWLSGDREQAEEITAETFARALTAPGNVRAGTVKGYLITIARNTFLEDRRKRRTHVELDPELPDGSARHDLATEARDEVRSVMAKLQKLPPADRQAVLMRADGLSYDEIAHSLKITTTSAKVKVHRARMKLLKWRTDNDL